MAICNHCQAEISDKARFCEDCGKERSSEKEQETVGTTPQEPAQRGQSPLLLILCIFSIVGSIFTIGRGLLYEMIADGHADNYIRGWIYALSGIGTLAGTIGMLMRKRLGLQVYTGFQLLYLGTVILAVIEHKEPVILVGALFFFLIPSALFLLAYWSAPCREQLS